jgi:hypothetical protein
VNFCSMHLGLPTSNVVLIAVSPSRPSTHRFQFPAMTALSAMSAFLIRHAVF